MITFACSGCRKPLSAKEDLAGKNVKCRACGQMTLVPSQSAAPVGIENMRTLPPSPAVDRTEDAVAEMPATIAA